jgi:simple sugar transport system substrate-binding protein
MKRARRLLMGAAAAALLASAGTALADDAPGKGITIYMQMGGNAGDGATLARQTGASAAATALRHKLNAHLSAWARRQ